jgi:hypothetical protein
MAIAKWTVFGWAPFNPVTGDRIRGRKWKEGDMPKSFKTAEAAEKWGNRELLALSTTGGK